jgi:hypothetical protein
MVTFKTVSVVFTVTLCPDEVAIMAVSVLPGTTPVPHVPVELQLPPVEVDVITLAWVVVAIKANSKK